MREASTDRAGETHLPVQAALAEGHEAFVDAELERVALRNELWVTTFVGVVVAVTTVVAIGVILSGLGRLGLVLVLMALVAGAYYLFVARPLLRRGVGLRVLRVVDVTLEVTLPTLVSLVDLQLMGGLYALTSTAPLLTFIGVAASGLRLSRRLCIYAGTLAASEYLALYALARLETPTELLVSLRSIGWGWAGQHVLYLLLAGFLGSVVARTGRSVTRRVAQQIMERERVTQIFGEYVSPEAVKRVLKGELSLGGERRVVTVLFADIRDFTPLSTRVEPEEALGFLNRYFEPMCDAVTRHGGMVNKFMGDGMLAVFGAPESDPDHARNACLAALDMVAAARDLVRPDGEPTRIGVGIHTGPVVLGSMGSDRRRDYTVIGDTVNTASRIEGLTKIHDAPILVSEAVVAASGLASEPIGPVPVKGRAEPVAIHRLTEDAVSGVRAAS